MVAVDLAELGLHRGAAARPAGRLDAGDAGLLDDDPAELADVGHECAQNIHRVELGLVGQNHRAVGRKRQVRRLRRQPHVEAHRPGDAELTLDGLGALRRARVTHGVAALYRNVAALGVVEHPLLGRPVAVDVGLHDRLVGVPLDVLQVAALQQRELGRRIARRDGPDVARLENRHALAGPGEQQGRHEPGEAAADDHLVVFRAVGELVGTDVARGRKPQGGHASDSTSRRSERNEMKGGLAICAPVW